ncbi:exonuclease 1-like [Brevipalpus obovatus]|uniref:exonuclease 1-like n=1 Tax=Brevipalpus obovatus TaxID=246614 RepID=UPI003D9E59EF
MGIQGLLPLLKSASMDINVDELSGSVALVDVYCWLHRAAVGCAEALFYQRETSHYLNFCLNRIRFLQKMGIKCILVFDGQALPAKRVTNDARRDSRDKTRLQIRSLLHQGKQSEANDLMRRVSEITPDMARKLILACREKKIDYIVAPYEADSQIAYLMKKKIGHFVITEDSDLLLFGCDYVMFKMDHNGRGSLTRKKKIFDCLGFKSSSFTFEKFRRMCILSGCDYLPNIPGIGLAKAKLFFSLTMCDDMRKVLPKLSTYLKMKNLKVPTDYVENFLKSEKTFKYQLVFCPIQRKMVPLNPYEDDVDPQTLDYAGALLDNDLALEFALGNVDKETMDVIDDYRPPLFDHSPNESDDSLWSKNYKPRDFNPLDVRFGIVEPPASKNPMKRAMSTISSQPTKRMHTDQEFEVNDIHPLDELLFTPSSSQEYREPVKSQVVRLVGHLKDLSDNYQNSSPVGEGAPKTLNILIKERDKKRQRLSNLMVLENSSVTLSPMSDRVDSQSSTPSSSQTSYGSQNETPCQKDIIELAQPLIDHTPPSEEEFTKKSIQSLQNFTFKSRPTQKL